MRAGLAGFSRGPSDPRRSRAHFGAAPYARDARNDWRRSEHYRRKPKCSFSEVAILYQLIGPKALGFILKENRQCYRKRKVVCALSDPTHLFNSAFNDQEMAISKDGLSLYPNGG